MATGQELNSYYVKVFIPNIIWSILCLVIGIVGNSCILLVYTFKMKKNGEQRYFIPFLALFDLCATLFAIIYFMLDYTHYGDFESEILCKIIVFSTYTWTEISCHTLLVIAVQRYLKICKPFGSQMTLFWRRVAVITTITYSAAFSSPLLYTSGLRKFERTFNNQNVTIRTCSINARNNQQFDIYFSSAMFLIFANILATIGVYIPVGYVIFKSFNFHKYQSSCKDKSSNNVSADTNLETNIDNKNKFENESSASSYSPTQIKNCKKGPLTKNNRKQSIKTLVSLNTSGSNTTNSSKTAKNVGSSQKEKVKVNFNLMFFTVIIFFLLSYIPVISVYAMKSNEVEYWHSLSDIQVRLELCLVRFYVINNIVNPFIYGYFDLKFRNSVKALIKCC